MHRPVESWCCCRLLSSVHTLQSRLAQHMHQNSTAVSKFTVTRCARTFPPTRFCATASALHHLCIPPPCCRASASAADQAANAGLDSDDTCGPPDTSASPGRLGLSPAAPVSWLQDRPSGSDSEGVKPPSSPAAPAGRQLGVPRLYAGLAGVPAAGRSLPPAGVAPPPSLCCGVARPGCGEGGAWWAAARAGVPDAGQEACWGLSCTAAILSARLPACWARLRSAALRCMMEATAGRQRIEMKHAC